MGYECCPLPQPSLTRTKVQSPGTQEGILRHQLLQQLSMGSDLPLSLALLSTPDFKESKRSVLEPICPQTIKALGLQLQLLSALPGLQVTTD